MAPTFEEADKVIATKTTEIERFDQIVFDAPDADETYIKRVIGVPGDSIEVRNDVLYVNGAETEEPYLDAKDGLLPGQKLMGDFTLLEKTGYETVPDGYLFVMGDNRLVSKDSRTFGLIQEDSVIGEVQLRFYPFTSIKIY
ncbi:signal peptidase I [Domibacillus tundrae]|uniref:signal peptidase I n=1 Tax=Domibacillus tundrae TaxID=1587527 RepID=UPI00316AC8B8